MGTCSTWVVFTDKHFHPYGQFLNVNSPFSKQKKKIESSSHGWSFLFWTFHILYKVMSNTCYIFSSLFLFHCFSQVATSFTSTSETSLIQILLKCLPSKATKNIICENCGTQIRRRIFWRYTRCSTGTLHSTQCPNFSTTSQTYLAFLL